MFSGLIAFTARIKAVERLASGGVTLRVSSPNLPAADVMLGDSIAVDGVCLTVTTFENGELRFDVVPETVRRSTLGTLATGQSVNLELSLRLGDRLGGHLVYAHVDATTAILGRAPEGQGERLSFALPAELRHFIIEKGYIAVNGTSLTIADTTVDRFTVAVIPETLRRTTLGAKHVGDLVNLEIDPIARYAVASAELYREQRA